MARSSLAKGHQMVLVRFGTIVPSKPLLIVQASHKKWPKAFVAIKGHPLVLEMRKDGSRMLCDPAEKTCAQLVR